MSEFQQAMLLRLRCELERIVIEREVMLAKNAQLKTLDALPAYERADFIALAERIDKISQAASSLIDAARAASQPPEGQKP